MRPHLRPIALLFVLLGLALTQARCDRGNGGAAPPSSATPSASALPSSAPASPSAGTSAAAAPTSSTAADGRPTAVPLLWEARKGQAVGWLFGTIHLGVEATQLAPVVRDRLRRARCFVMEADIGGVDPFAALRLSMLPEGQSLRAKLAPASWKLVEQKLGASYLGMPVDRLKPWMVMTMLTQQLAPLVTPMDMVLQGEAREAGKKLVYLEDVMEQLAIIDEAVTPKVLDDTLAEYDKASRLVRMLIAAYLDGDVATLEKAIFDPEDLKKHARLYELTFTKRNAAWLPKLDRELAAGGAFVAVGSGHWLGADGLIARLGRRGYRIERLLR